MAASGQSSVPSESALTMRSAPGSVGYVPFQSSEDSSQHIAYHPIDLSDDTVTRSGGDIEGKLLTKKQVNHSKVEHTMEGQCEGS